MKARVNLDKRGKIAKREDELLNAMKRDAGLNPRQFAIVGHYYRELIGLKIHETEAAVEMSYLIALIEGEKYGTDPGRGAVKIPRVQKNACEARNEAYGKSCVDANGNINVYDGCGLEHLQIRLARHGVDYEFKEDING
jgi:hypothetical protein